MASAGTCRTICSSCCAGLGLWYVEVGLLVVVWLLLLVVPVIVHIVILLLLLG